MPKKNKYDEVLQVRVSSELLKQIDKEARDRGLSRSEYIRYCMQKEIDGIAGLTLSKKGREQFKELMQE